MTVLEIERRRVAVQAQLDQLKTGRERNVLGQYATPSALAASMAKYAWGLFSEGESVRFIDPAIGTGSFFSALLATTPTERDFAAAGVELDGAFVDAAASLWGKTQLRVTQGDFTKQPIPSPSERFNLILTNPPYVRHHHLNSVDKRRLQERVSSEMGIKISGLAGLYAYFMLLADAWLSDGGFGIWLIPSEFMDVNYGRAVKEYLAERVSLLQIHRFLPADVQFDDALVSSAIVVFQKVKPPHGHHVRLSLGGPLESPTTSQNVPMTDLAASRKWTAFQKASHCHPTEEGLRLRHLFTIKRGIATGDNSFFMLPRSRAMELGIPDECLKPILPSPRYMHDSIVEADADGYPQVHEPLALIDCPYPGADVESRFPAFWAYLKQGADRGVNRRYITSRRDPWYSQEQRDPPPFLCSYMGRERNGRKPFRFFLNRSKAITANVYLLLYPKPSLAALLKSSPGLDLMVLEALQRVTTEAFIAEGRVYGGGLYKMEPAELGFLPAGELTDMLGVRPAVQSVLFG
jgi:adenine-specific DNA-methyltransferase